MSQRETIGGPAALLVVAIVGIILPVTRKFNPASAKGLMSFTLLMKPDATEEFIRNKGTNDQEFCASRTSLI